VTSPVLKAGQEVTQVGIEKRLSAVSAPESLPLMIRQQPFHARR
jgi:hypothetical protein